MAILETGIREARGQALELPDGRRRRCTDCPWLWSILSASSACTSSAAAPAAAATAAKATWGGVAICVENPQRRQPCKRALPRISAGRLQNRPGSSSWPMRPQQALAPSMCHLPRCAPRGVSVRPDTEREAWAQQQHSQGQEVQEAEGRALTRLSSPAAAAEDSAACYEVRHEESQCTPSGRLRDSCVTSAPQAGDWCASDVSHARFGQQFVHRDAFCLLNAPCGTHPDGSDRGHATSSWSIARK